MTEAVAKKKFFSFRERFLWSLGLIAVSTGFDQWTKDWAVKSLKGAPERVYWDGMVKILYAENTGAWGSIGSDLPEPWRMIALTIVPIAFLVGLLIYTLRKADLPRYEVICYALVVGGGTGNLIDRAWHGYVVDFLWMGLTQKIATNIFNVADVVIMTGVISLIVLQIYFNKKEKRGTPDLLTK